MTSSLSEKFFHRGMRRFHSCRGMTLVELMVVTGILGVVMGAVYSLMLPVQKSTFTQTEVADLHDDMRLALKHLTLDVRHAGLLVNDNNGTVPPIVVTGDGNGFTLRRRIMNPALGAQVSCAPDPIAGSGYIYRIVPPLLTSRFETSPPGGEMPVRLLNTLAVDSSAPEWDEAKIRVNDIDNNNRNGRSDRYDNDTVTFSIDLGECDTSTAQSLFVFPRRPGEPVVRTVTYIFNPADPNPDPANPRPTLRRFEDWPPDGTPVPDPLPNPLPPNWLLLGGDSPVAGNLRKTFGRSTPLTPVFSYDQTTQMFSVDITGWTRAYNPSNPNDSLANAKPRRLQTSVALRNAILER